jgi:hypothetical protein
MSSLVTAGDVLGRFLSLGGNYKNKTRRISQVLDEHTEGWLLSDLSLSPLPAASTCVRNSTGMIESVIICELVAKSENEADTAKTYYAMIKEKLEEPRSV